MTRQEAIELLDAYDADPDGFLTCDNLCTVADALPGQPTETLSGEPLTSDALREMVDADLDDDEDEEEA
jgi:Ca2+-binding EF-hand superfamily protein